MEFHAFVCPPTDTVHTYVHVVSEDSDHSNLSNKILPTRVQHVSSSGSGSVFHFDKVTGYTGNDEEDDDEENKEISRKSYPKENNKEMENAARGSLDGLLAAVVSGTSVAVIIGGEADDFGIKQQLVKQVILTAAKELFAMRDEALESFPEDGPAFSMRLSCFAIDADVPMDSVGGGGGGSSFGS